VPSIRSVIAVLLAWTGTWWLALGLLLHPVLPGGWLSIAAAALLTLAPVPMLVRGFAGGAYPSARTRIWIYRPFWYVQLFVPLLAVAGLAGALAGLPFGVAGPSGRWAMATVAAGLLVLAVWGYAGTRRLVVRRLDVPVPGLPPGLEGMRVAQLSDLHVGPHTPPGFLARVAEAVREARPDLIVFTGDQVDDFARDVEPFAAAFGALTAPLGVFAIPGNHDVYAGWTEVRRGMEAMGTTALVNRAVPLRRGGDRFWVAGTGDPAGHAMARGGGAEAAPDVERTLAGIPPGEFTLALAHNPALWPALAARGVELTLSGHTHYGQVAIPSLGWNLASLFLEHSAGSYREGRATLYINPGTNYWGIPFRLGTPPEVTVVTLRWGEGAGGSG